MSKMEINEDDDKLTAVTVLETEAPLPDFTPGR